MTVGGGSWGICGIGGAGGYPIKPGGMGGPFMSINIASRAVNIRMIQVSIRYKLSILYQNVRLPVSCKHNTMIVLVKVGMSSRERYVAIVIYAKPSFCKCEWCLKKTLRNSKIVILNNDSLQYLLLHASLVHQVHIRHCSS